MSEKCRVFYRVFFGNGVPYGFSYDWVFSCIADSSEQAFRIACEDCEKELHTFEGTVRVCNSVDEKKTLYSTHLTRNK